jgi:DNA-binding transcriptional ArsR family regulator
MTAEADIAAVGALIGDRARASMLNALMSGEAISAGELARVGGVSPSGATAHLRRLREGGLVAGERAGRQRVYRLASAEIAEALEALALVAPPAPVRGLREARAAEAMKRARTCYDHLAGELGVAVTAALVDRELLAHDDGGFAVTGPGGVWLRDLGIDLDALRRARGAASRVGASTGPSGGRMWPGRSAPGSRARSSTTAGSAAGPAAARSRSRPPERTGSSATWVSPVSADLLDM